jgi:hypothetical protein
VWFTLKIHHTQYPQQTNKIQKTITFASTTKFLPFLKSFPSNLSRNLPFKGRSFSFRIPFPLIPFFNRSYGESCRVVDTTKKTLHKHVTRAKAQQKLEELARTAG